MSATPINLDARRSARDQVATKIRRLRSLGGEDVQEEIQELDDLEAELLSKPARNLRDAVAKARYLIFCYSETAEARDPDHQKRILGVLDELQALSDKEKRST